MLRLRTSYSFRHAVGDIGKVLSTIKEKEWPYAPITDRDSTYGWVKWLKKSEKIAPGLPPILGVELAVSPSPTASRPIFDYWTFLPLGDNLQGLNQLVALATKQFRYRPLISYEQALEAEGVVKIMGYKTLLSRFPYEGQPEVYCGLGPSIVRGYWRAIEGLEIPWVAVCDNYFPRPNDLDLYQVVCGRNAADQTWPQWIMGKEEWSLDVKQRLPEAMPWIAWQNMVELGIRCIKARPDKAILPKPSQTDTHLLDYCMKGARTRNLWPLNAEYLERLNKELRLIEEKQFGDYFLIVSDVVAWAKKRMIVGPARGSSCGSLVCYLMGITDIDPIPHGLIFERFIDRTRMDLPDIDIDFSDQHREKVIQYLRDTYGKDHVSRLGTVNLYRPRSALNESAKAMGIDLAEIAPVMDSMIQRSSADARALDTLEDTLTELPAGKELSKKYPQLRLACDMEGQPRHAGQHASAVVLNAKNLDLLAPTDVRNQSLMLDKYDCESLDLLKIDCLGLTQLSILEDCLALAKLPHDYLLKVPMDDAAAFQPLQDLKFVGIFQFQGIALKSLAKLFKMTEFNDIVMITALARPGPLVSGNANKWVQRRSGAEKVSYPHEVFEPYLRDTLGIVCFQEQVMEIGRNIGDLSWDDVTALRKAMSKSLGAEFFDRYGDPWKAGAKKKGIPEVVLDKIWTDLCFSGDCVIENPFPSRKKHRYITVRELWKNGGMGPGGKNWFNRRQQILSFDGERIRPMENVAIFKKGKQQTYTLRTESGKEVHVTRDHKIMTPEGWRELRDLRRGDKVLVDGGPWVRPSRRKKGVGRGAHNWWPRKKRGEELGLFERQRQILKATYKTCQSCRNAPYQETHHINLDNSDHRLENLLPVCSACHRRIHRETEGATLPWQRGRVVTEEKVKSIRKRKIEDVFDISMPGPYHNLLLNKIVVSNCAYGSWSFNKSHAVAYGLISYWCCYCKAHYPLEFMAATLNHVGDIEKQRKVLQEAVREGFHYKPVDPASSGKEWSIKGDTLIGPLSNIKGVGPKTIRDILHARRSRTRLKPAIERKLHHPKTLLDTLWPIRDGIKRVCPSLEERNIRSAPTKIEEIQQQPEKRNYLILGTPEKINPRDANEAILIAKRGYKITGEETRSLNLHFADDTAMIFCKISRRDYVKMAEPVVKRGRPGKALYAIKGYVPANSSFMILMVTAIRYLGDMEDYQLPT